MRRYSVAALGIAVFGVLLVAVAVPLFAHHSTFMFVSDKTTTLEGTITELALGNPHSVFFLDAKPVDQQNAAMKNWSVEAPPPRRLTAAGWQQGTIKPGDKVKVTGFAHKDGRRQILLIELTDDKGHKFSIPEADYGR